MGIARDRAGRRSQEVVLGFIPAFQVEMGYLRETSRGNERLNSDGRVKRARGRRAAPGGAAPA
jgi:hypothetical protein